MPEEMPIWAKGRGDLRDLHVIHQSKRELTLALQSGTRAPRGQHDDFPGPERRQHPFDNVAFGMAFAIDVAILVDLVAARADDFGIEGHVAVRQADAVELNLHVPFAPEMTGFLSRLEMANEIASAGECLAS